MIKVTISPNERPRIAVSIFGKCGTTIPLDSRWGKFLQILAMSNVRLVSLDESELEFFLSIDFSKDTYDLVSRKSRLRHRVLVAVEPPSVNAAQFKFQNYSKFDSIITIPTLVKYFSKATSWTPGFVDRVSDRNAVENPEFRFRPIAFGLLSSNKYSPFKSSLYELRKQIILEFARTNLHIVIAGADWDKNKCWNFIQFLKTTLLNVSYLNIKTFRVSFSLFRLRRNHYHYLGKVESSLAFYQQLKFVICIESDIDDFSEKLFEVNLAGAIPLYVGPKGIEHFGVEPNAFVPMPQTSKEFVQKARELLHLSENYGLPSPGSEWLNNWTTEESFYDLRQKIFSIISHDLDDSV